MSADRPLTEQARKRLWIADHRGVLFGIVKERRVSRQFVSDVFYGRRRSRDGAIEKLLAKAGAPGFAQ